MSDENELRLITEDTPEEIRAATRQPTLPQQVHIHRAQFHDFPIQNYSSVVNAEPWPFPKEHTWDMFQIKFAKRYAMEHLGCVFEGALLHRDGKMIGCRHVVSEEMAKNPEFVRHIQTQMAMSMLRTWLKETNYACFDLS